MPRNVNAWKTTKGNECDLRVQWIDDQNRAQEHAAKVKVKDIAAMLPEDWLIDKYVEMTVSGTLPLIEAMADSALLTFWQRVGRWFVRHSTILQWWQRRG